ncbi:MAG: restriction endonuclease subunit S, partial [Lentisphaeria bacterium]|nr:restriction endonuclease subunit S [Lentisphaeria bacterium]
MGHSRPISEVRKGYTQFQDGDILIAKITPCMENGKAAVVNGLLHGVGYGSTEFHVVRLLSTDLCARFYFHYVVQRAFRREARRHMTGSAGQLRVPSTYLAAVAVPLPPLPEQRRIVAKIEELFTRLDAGVAALHQVKQQIRRYRQAVLRDAFTGELTREWRGHRDGAEAPLPDTWKAMTYGDLTSLVTSGSRGWSRYYADSGSLFIRAQDIKHDCLNRLNVARVRVPEGAEGSRTLVRRYDILITITGANVTKTAVVCDPIEDAYVSQHVALTRPVDSRMSRYLYYWLVSPCNGRRFLLALAYGAGKPGLNLTNLRELDVPIPPLDEREQIVAEIDRHFSLADFAEKAVDESLAKAEHLRQS